MSNNELKEKKSAIDFIGPAIYLIIYIVAQLTMPAIGKAGPPFFQGICAQILLLFSAFVVVAFPRYGYYVAVASNLFAIGSTVISFKHGNQNAITGAMTAITTIVLITIIFIFYKKIIKNNEDLLTANKVLKDKDEKLTYLAYYDILTGLPNRQLFIERIDEAINSAAPFTVIAANIDNFKNINNELGNNAGDAVLCSYSKKLKKLCGNSIFLARINGDEFGFILYGTESESGILNYVNTVKEVISEPIRFNDIKVNITMSFGISLYPVNATESTEMLKCVSSALSVAKANGKNTQYFFNNMINR